MKGFQRFWYEWVCNPWSYVIVAIWAIPILFFISIVFTFVQIQSHPEKIGGFFGKIVAGFEEQRSNYNFEDCYQTHFYNGDPSTDCKTKEQMVAPLLTH